MDVRVPWSPSKMGKSPQIWKSREIWKWLDIWCVGSVHIGIFILTCVETRKRGRVLVIETFRDPKADGVLVRIGARRSCDV